MFLSDWVEGRAGALGGWRCIIRLCGAQSVMISGTSVMLRWSAGSWVVEQHWGLMGIQSLVLVKVLCGWTESSAEGMRFTCGTVLSPWKTTLTAPTKNTLDSPVQVTVKHMGILFIFRSFYVFIILNVFVSVLTDVSVSTTPATTTSASPSVSPPVRSTSVSPPQTPPAASLSVPPVLVIVLGVVLLLLLVPLLILIQQNRVMRRGRRDPETVILCLIQCVISHVLWTDSRFCLSTLTALSKRRHRTTTEAVYEEIQHRHNHFTQRGETWAINLI